MLRAGATSPVPERISLRTSSGELVVAEFFSAVSWGCVHMPTDTCDRLSSANTGHKHIHLLHRDLLHLRPRCVVMDAAISPALAMAPASPWLPLICGLVALAGGTITGRFMSSDGCDPASSGLSNR
jgi:hypothetical protein